MIERETLDLQSGVAGDEFFLDGCVETDNERAECIVCGLRPQFLGIDLFGEDVYELVERPLVEPFQPACFENGEQAFAAVHLVVVPRPGLEVRLAARQPLLPPRAEGALGVAQLAALDLLGESTLGVPRRTWAREATLARGGAVGASSDVAPACALLGLVWIDAALGSVVGLGVAPLIGVNPTDRVIECDRKLLVVEAT